MRKTMCGAALLLSGGTVQADMASLPENVKINSKNVEGIILISNKINVEITKLIPRNICVGIGCKKGTRVEDLEMFVNEVFQDLNLHLESIKTLNSCWVKQEEEG